MAGLKFHKVKSLPTASTSLTGNIYFNESDKTINICTGTGWSTYNGNNTWRPLGTGATDAAAGNHTHDGRYYTESEIDTKLATKSNTNHTHNYAGSSTAGGNATKADSITTTVGNTNTYRNVFFAYDGDKTKVVYDDDFTYNPGTNTLKIGAGTLTATNYSGNAATATKVGTSTAGSTTMPVYIKSGTPTAITSFPEAYLSWGGKNFSGSYGPIDAAMIPDLGACRSMFARAAGITIQYSRNGGSTWVDYGLIDTQKTALFSVGHGIVIGGTTETGIDKSKYKLRVIVTTDLARIYTTLNKIAIYVSTSGSTGSNVTIDARTKANVDAGSDTWTTLANSAPVNGWSGWNIINIPDTITYGNNSTQYQQIRFTFGVTSHASTVAYPGLSVSRIMMFGGVGWVAPSNMAGNGHLYSYDSSQNATFPGAITATMFKKSGGTSSQFLKADGSVDSNTYSKSSHTHTSVLDVSERGTITFAYSKAGLSYGDYTHLAGWYGSELRAINKSQFAQASHSHTGSEVKLTGYSKASSYSAIAASDTVNQAIGKLEGAISGLETLLASI